MFSYGGRDRDGEGGVWGFGFFFKLFYVIRIKIMCLLDKFSIKVGF